MSSGRIVAAGMVAMGLALPGCGSSGGAEPPASVPVVVGRQGGHYRVSLGSVTLVVAAAPAKGADNPALFARPLRVSGRPGDVLTFVTGEIGEPGIQVAASYNNGVAEVNVCGQRFQIVDGARIQFRDRAYPLDRSATVVLEADGSTHLIE